jgi:uncharacterized protein
MKENYLLFYKVAGRGLNTLENLCNKAEAFATEKSVAQEKLITAQLAPDMFNFQRQVEIYTDGVVGGVYRLAGMEKPNLESCEQTFASLKARIVKARELLKSVEGEVLKVTDADIESKKIALPWMGGMHFEGKTFLEDFIFINNMFHLTTAYNILRLEGVPLGKGDFLGQIEMKK